MANATEVVAEVLETHGRGTLSCDSCDAHETYIDNDASNADITRVASLLEHARYDHISPRSVVFTAPAVVVA